MSLLLRFFSEDYRQFNAIRQNELENLYKSKLDRIRHDFEEQKNEKTSTKPKDFLSALNSSKKERRDLIEENRTLNSKLGQKSSRFFLLDEKFSFFLEQFERNFNEIIEENHRNYSKLNREYRQLEIEIPELDRLLVDLRSNAVSLCSEIQTYRYLLSHLVSTNEISTAPVKEKKSRREYRDEKTGLIVHIEDGLIWVRI